VTHNTFPPRQNGQVSADAADPASAIEAAMRLLTAALIAARADSVEHSDSVAVAPLLDVAETARLLKVSRMTVVRLIDERRIPAVIVRRGGSQKIRRIPRAFILRLLADANAGAQVDVDQLTTAWLAEMARPEVGPERGVGYATSSSAREVRSAR
jgi:excisionase family DNA binding protein